MPVTPELAHKLRARIDAYIYAETPDFLELRRAARALDALPIAEVRGRWQGLRSAGEVVSFVPEPPHDARTEEDGSHRAFVLALARFEYPELDGLVPPRFLNSRVCPRCGGAGRISLAGGDVPCVCGGLGWIPPMDDEAHDETEKTG